MNDAWICDGIRTPIGRYGGCLSSVRPDDLMVAAINELIDRNRSVDWDEVSDLLVGCSNQSGEDNRNVARMSGLLSALPDSVPAITLNRLCASGMDAVTMAARSIKCGESGMAIAGGVESMSRAPYVVAKPDKAFSRSMSLEDTTMGWRMVHPDMKERFGTDSMPETGENVAEEYSIAREDQDAFAFRSQQRAKRARDRGFFDDEIVPVRIRQSKEEVVIVAADEHPRPETTLEKLSRLKPFVKADGTLTAGNSSGINDGACAMLVAGRDAIDRFALKPLARIVRSVTVGVPPRVMGIGPAPATKRLLEETGISMDDVGTIELNEAFASQSLAVLRELGLPDDAEWVNPNGGAIALGHPLGMSGARLLLTAARQMQSIDKPYGVCTLCVGVGQGSAVLLERAE